jgi:hypothetical protein
MRLHRELIALRGLVRQADPAVPCVWGLEIVAWVMADYRRDESGGLVLAVPFEPRLEEQRLPEIRRRRAGAAGDDDGEVARLPRLSSPVGQAHRRSLHPAGQSPRQADLFASGRSASMEQPRLVIDGEVEEIAPSIEDRTERRSLQARPQLPPPKAVAPYHALIARTRAHHRQ